MADFEPAVSALDGLRLLPHGVGYWHIHRLYTELNL